MGHVDERGKHGENGGEDGGESVNVASMAKTAVKDVVLGKWLPSVYELAVEARPLDTRKALFVAQKGHALSDNFQLMYEHLRAVHGFDVEFVSLRYDEVSYPVYLRNCAAMVRKAATARLVFLDDASDIMSCVHLRDHTDVVQLWHACGAFKKFGMSTAEKRFGGTRAEKERHPFYENLSLVTVSSPEIEWAYREAMAIDEEVESAPAVGENARIVRATGDGGDAEAAGADSAAYSMIVISDDSGANEAGNAASVASWNDRIVHATDDCGDAEAAGAGLVERGSRAAGDDGGADKAGNTASSTGWNNRIVRATGVSRTDVYFDEGFRAAASEYVRAALPAAGERRLVLYAPTFRGTSSHAAGPDRLDVRALKEAIGDEWFLVVKHHPFVKEPPAIPPDCADFACMAPAGARIDELLCAADACVTDYSSIVFEYSLLDRPMAFFAYDLDDYDDWRGFYYDYDAMTPGPVLKTTAELADYLAHSDARYDAAQMAAFRRRFMSACDGRSTARIAQMLLARS